MYVKRKEERTPFSKLGKPYLLTAWRIQNTILGSLNTTASSCQTTFNMQHNFTWEEYVDLRPNNTFKLPSVARHLVRIHTQDLEQLVCSHRYQRHRRLVLGSGSNILLATPLYDGIVLKNELSDIEIISRNTSSTALKVGGGLLWDSLVAFCVEHDLGGLENLSMIPGTVGAAPAFPARYTVRCLYHSPSKTARPTEIGQCREFFSECPS